jgi:hypothetical protein
VAQMHETGLEYCTVDRLDAWAWRMLEVCQALGRGTKYNGIILVVCIVWSPEGGEEVQKLRRTARQRGADAEEELGEVKLVFFSSVPVGAALRARLDGVGDIE